MPSGDNIREASDIFQVLSDPTRIKILHLLTDQELCVHDLTKILDVSQSSVSHHLKLLRMQRLVKTRREGRAVYYSLADSHVLQLVNQCLDHSAH